MATQPTQPVEVRGAQFVASQAFVDQLNIQIGNEFAAHQQYVACAVYYDALTMPQMAGFFYRQALEERDHAMMMVKYLVEPTPRSASPGVAQPENRLRRHRRPGGSWRSTRRSG